MVADGFLTDGFLSNPAFLQQVIDAAPIVISIKDRDGRYVLCNQYSAERHGLAPSDFLGKTVSEIFKSQAENTFRDEITAIDTHVIATGMQIPFFEETIFVKNEERRMMTSKTPLIDESGETTFVLTIAIDISERKDMEAALIIAKEEAELANRTKSDFLANMSHELRTPLNSIIGFAQILSTGIFGPLGDRRYTEYAADIMHSGEHLLSVIGDVLDISKIEAGEAAIVDRELNIGEMLADSVAMIHERAQAKSLNINMIVADGLPDLVADARYLKQILINLLANSVKFTPAGGNIDIHANIDTDGCMSISVKDTGIGITAADISRVLEPFGQVLTNPTLAQEGTGLGLSLSKRLTELHAGGLSIESTPGVGTTVTAQFPASRIVPPTV